MQATIPDPWPELARRLTNAHYCQDLEVDVEVSSASRQYIHALQRCVAIGVLSLAEAVSECEDHISRGIQ